MSEIKNKAVEKLKKELAAAKEQYASPIIEHLLKRCDEDEGLAADVMQEHKTWGNCIAYLTDNARKQKSGSCAMVEDRVVYEWAEDYYRDDKADDGCRKSKEFGRKTAKEKTKPKAAKTAPKVEGNDGKTKGLDKPLKSLEKPQSKPRKRKTS